MPNANIRVNKITEKDTNQSVEVSKLAPIGAADGAVIYVDTITDLQALDTSGLVEGQSASVQGSEFRWDGSEWQAKNNVTVAAYGAAGSDNTDIVQQVIDDWGKVYIPSGYHYRRRDITVPVGAFVVDDSTGIRVTSDDYWWDVKHTKVTTLAHRAAPRLAPENTMAGISNAFCQGFDGIEIDIMWTSDNVPVLFHDSTMDRTTDGTGSVSDYSLNEIQQLDAGSYFSAKFHRCRVPTLEKALNYMKGRFERIHLEIKGAQSTDRLDILLGMVESRGMDDQVIFIAYDYSALEYIRTKNTRVGLGFIDSSESELFDIQKNGGRLYCSFTDSVYENTPDIVSKANASGISVYGKTTNSYADAQKMINFGVSVVQSDNAIMVQGRAGQGSVVRFPINLEGANVTESAGSITSNIDLKTVIIEGETGGRTGLNFVAPLAPGDYFDVEFYAISISGDLPLVYMEGVDGGPTIEMEVNAPQDVYKVKERIYLTSGLNIDYRNNPLRIGYGSARAGVSEFFDIKVRSSSVLHTPHDGSVAGLVDLSATPEVSNNWQTYGIAGVELDNSRVNVVHILLEKGLTIDSLLPTSFGIVSTVSDSLKVAKFLRYNAPGSGSNPSSEFGSLEVAVFNPDGSIVDIANDNVGFLSIKA